MRKKILAALLIMTAAINLTACGSGTGFSEDDLVLKGPEDIVVDKDYAVIAYEDTAYFMGLVDDDYEEYEGDYATSRGLELGGQLEDYKKLYGVKNGYAVWELFSGDNNEYTSFDAYSNQSAGEMYDEANNVWLDLGWCKEGGKWRAMTDVEVRDTWFCDADYDDFDEIVFLSVNLDEMDEVIGLAIYHVTYDEAWADYQAWE